MYSDLFDPLGGRSAARHRGAASSPPEGPPPLVSLDAGKIALELQDDGSYQCTPDPLFRGQIRLIWQSGSLHWQTVNRKTQPPGAVESTTAIANGNGRLTRVEATHCSNNANANANADHRIYVYTKGAGQYEMYWMQQMEHAAEAEAIETFNQFLKDPESAKPASEVVEAAGNANNNSTSTSNAAQVDALSSILENLGMPPDPAAAPAAPTGTLTLADLQGAMAGIPASTGPPVPLDSVVHEADVDALLEHEGARGRLQALLPEGQQDATHLREHLTAAPAVQQTLRALTQALLPDDAGNMDAFYSVLANFQLDPADASTALQQNNDPIQGFLDALLASVEKDQNNNNDDAGESGDSNNAANDESPDEEMKE